MKFDKDKLTLAKRKIAEFKISTGHTQTTTTKYFLKALLETDVL